MDHAIDRLPARLAPPGMLGDARLARLAARGDEAAFSAIFRRYHQQLYRYCRAITGNGEDASDALQNTMVKAMRSLPGEERAIELKPWLFRVAHNEAVSLLRQRKPQSELEESDGATVEGPEAGVADREDMRGLMDDLHDLPGRQRAAVILRELNGLSYADIGAVFGTSTVAAKQAAYDGRLALQDYAKGRAMDCETVTRALSDDDRHFVRGRKLRGHLRSCPDCAAFKGALEARRGQFAALAPALPATAAAALMGKLFGGGGGSAGGGAGLGISAAGGKLAASVGAFKGAAVVAVVAAGAGAGAGVGKAVLDAGNPGDGAAANVRAAETHQAAGARAQQMATQARRAPAGGRSGRSPSAHGSRSALRRGSPGPHGVEAPADRAALTGRRGSRTRSGRRGRAVGSPPAARRPPDAAEQLPARARA